MSLNRLSLYSFVVTRRYTLVDHEMNVTSSAPTVLAANATVQSWISLIWVTGVMVV
jgi:hypothetical protein